MPTAPTAREDKLIIQTAVASTPLPQAVLRPCNRRHLDALTGELGILHGAKRSRPNAAQGHRVDDIAWALQVDLLHARTLGWPAVAESAWRNLQFLQAAFDHASGMFRTYRAASGSWLDGKPAELSQGRVMLALGETIASTQDADMRAAAAELWALGLPGAGRLTDARAQAAVVLACDAILREGPDEPVRALLARYSRNLDRRLRASASSDWFWLEDDLASENGLLPRSLIVAGMQLGSSDMVGTGVQVVDWLLRVQVSASGHLSPLGTEGWARGGVRSRFDQLPLDATAMLLAAEAALEATGESRFRAAMELAYSWFLGNNDLAVPVAHAVRGAASDGLTPAGAARSEGAESTLMWLMAAEHIRALRARPTAPIVAPSSDPARGRIGDAGYAPLLLAAPSR